MTVVLKLGGSVLTRKDRQETLDDGALGRAADAIGSALDDGTVAGLVLVHGAGSFGHPQAARHGLSRESGSRDAAAIREVHGAVRRLNDAVVDRLAHRGVPALPVHPLSAAARDPDGDLELPTAAVSTLLGEGFVPVLHGDLVAHAGRGATIVSGDELVARLAPRLAADRVGLCSAVPGVLDGAGAVVPEIRSIEAVADVLGDGEGPDVTGGMAAKVRELLALDAPAHVFGLDDLGTFLAGGSPGTLIDGSAGP